MAIASALKCAGFLFISAFEIMEHEGKLRVSENGAPVFVYNFAAIEAPKPYKENLSRGCYIHPLHGLDGEILTQDFPFDHPHHRGVFWAWPDSSIGDTKVDTWSLDACRAVHDKFLTQYTENGQAHIVVQNSWILDENPESPIMREEISITVHPQSNDSRAIDFDLRFINIATEEIVLRGATTDNKGYGGFSFRPDATRKPFTFTTAQGIRSMDILEENTPWADISFATEKGGDIFSGVAIFQHPANPDYPHPGWMLRHYGFLGASWPHTKPHTLQPGNETRLQYRLFIHKGKGEQSKIHKEYETWASNFSD